MSAADLLLHPAVQEAAGIVLLEAIVAGLPVLTTEVCGYAHYINAAQCGVVIPEPFAQEVLNASSAMRWRKVSSEVNGQVMQDTLPIQKISTVWLIKRLISF